MGASNSTRTVVIENESGSGIISVTEAVTKRLQGLPEGDTKTERTEPIKRDFVEESLPARRIPHKTSDDVKKLENYYQSKLAELEKRNASLLKQTTEQFASAVQEVEKKFLKTTGPQVCPDLQTKVYQCYQANPDTPLDCSAAVRAFVDCVEKARQNALLRKG